MKNNNSFCGYFPDRLVREVKDLGVLKILHYVFAKAYMSKTTENLLFKQEEVKKWGLSRMTVNRLFKKLQTEKWLYIKHPNSHTYFITINPNYHFETCEINYLEGKGRN